jgi:hypothetical protein
MPYIEVDSNQGSCRHFLSGLAERNARSDDPWSTILKVSMLHMAKMMMLISGYDVSTPDSEVLCTKICGTY